MARSIDNSLSLLETTLSDITTSLSNKGVTAEGLKASQVPDKIREIEIIKEAYAGEVASLYTGIEFPNTYPTHIIFTDTKAPKDTDIVDWSRDNNNSVVKWLDSDSDTLYVSSQHKGVKIIFPEDCSYMFGNHTTNKTTQTIVFDNVDMSQVTLANCMFVNCNKIESIDLSDINMENVTTMESMFSNCRLLETINLDNINSKSLTSMYYMFSWCTSLSNLSLENFNTSNVVDMSYCFENCQQLKTFAMKDWDTSNVKEMRYMFMSCSNLTDVDVNNMNTNKLRRINGFFQNCKMLKAVSFEGVDFSNTYDLGGMFQNCSQLTTVDLSSWTGKGKDDHGRLGVGNMFNSCGLLSTIYCQELYGKGITAIYNGVDMFLGCTSLPNFNTSNRDFSMAKWKENGGYFTNPAEKSS